ncbi:MAG TPA: DUF2268 domain-containing putative Zn-dependent protease [Rhizomicrobium sp.]|nr:DUF2268 domain-containing putative Zn-dependent protease [Rhizomicrobium sp.]
MRPRGVVFAILAACAAATAAAEPAAGPVIDISDVDLFYKVYDAADGHPTADQFQHDYLDKGSEGLHALAQARNVTGARIADMLAKRPEMYIDARRCVTVLPHVKERLQIALHRLGELYPEARFPPVTIAIGRGKPVGIGSPATGVEIGLEALCSINYLNASVEDRFVHVVTHEYVHVQQVQALVDDDAHWTVLEGSVIEGAAEFLTELVSGAGYSVYVAEMKGHEKDIETRFVPDEDKTDLSQWLNNGTADNPADLGYGVGYRICKSYYEHAADKRQAVRDIIRMTDPHAFLAKSGWYPGIVLQ